MDTLIKSQNKKIYSAYDVHISCNINIPPDQDVTKQSFGEQCDINCIMSRYEKTGIIESGNSLPASYGEASAFDFQEAQNLLISAENHFNALPAKIRSKFDNNPHTMLAYMDNPQNHEEAITLGLLPAPKVVGVVPQTPTPAGASIPLKTPADALSGQLIPTP